MIIFHNDSRDKFEILKYEKGRVDVQMDLDMEFINFYDTDNDGYYFAKSGIK